MDSGTVNTHHIICALRRGVFSGLSCPRENTGGTRRAMLLSAAVDGLSCSRENVGRTLYATATYRWGYSPRMELPSIIIKSHLLNALFPRINRPICCGVVVLRFVHGSFRGDWGNSCHLVDPINMLYSGYQANLIIILIKLD